MASQNSRSTRRTPRKPRPSKTAIVEEFDREEIAAVDFGDDDGPAPAADVEETRRPSRRGSRQRAAETTRDDDFGADIVSEERDGGARETAEGRRARDEQPPPRRRSREADAGSTRRSRGDESASRRSDADDGPARGNDYGRARDLDHDDDVQFSDEPVTRRSEQSGNDQADSEQVGGAGQAYQHRDEGHTSQYRDEGGGPPREDSHAGQQQERGGRRGRRRRRRGRGQGGDQQQGGYQQHGGGGGGGGYQQRGRYDNQRGNRGGYQGHGGQGGHRQDRGNRQQNRGRHQKAAVGASHEPAVMSGTFEGVLELHPKLYGFLRTAANDFGAVDTDPFVSSTLVEKYNLREGVKIIGEVGPGVRGQGPRLLEVTSIDGRTPEEYAKIKHFDNLTPINPFEMIKLETGPTPITMRVMDLLTPIGKGQRALIVAPPRSGKTMLLQDIANAVSTNHPEIHLIVLLIDERPEEVTDMRRTVRGEVIASSMDRDVESHVRISQLVMERGKRIAESGGHCLVLMDSVTRCARAFNKWVGGGRDAKIQTGGLDVRAMEIPRKMFGLARRFDEGGSLTVAATALIDTGSRMDDAIFLEFKGTGNMELVLSRDLAERRIWPAIDISKSGTRREEKLLAPEQLEGITMLRRALVSMNPVDAMLELTKKLAQFPTNAEFLSRVRQVL